MTFLFYCLAYDHKHYLHYQFLLNQSMLQNPIKQIRLLLLFALQMKRLKNYSDTVGNKKASIRWQNSRHQFQAVMEKYTNTISGYQFRATVSLTDFWVYQVSLMIARPCIMKLHSRLLSFTTDRFGYFNPISRDLRVTYNFNWWLLGKPVFDCMFAVIKLFSISLMAAALWGKVCATHVLPTGVGPFAFRYQGNGWSYHLPIYWYHSKGNWLRYNFAADSFYI